MHNPESAIRMNTVLVRYGHPVCSKQYKKNEGKTRKAIISMKTISVNDSAKRSAFSAG